jgi:hypothetical protein
VLIAARVRRRGRSRSGAMASLFEEIYCARTAALPDSVTDALVALSLAHRPRRVELPSASSSPVQDPLAAEAALNRSRQPRARVGSSART